jgi:hypothetical protein
MSTTEGPDRARSRSADVDENRDGTLEDGTGEERPVTEEHPADDERATTGAPVTQVRPADERVVDERVADEPVPTREDVVAREKARYGGMKFGSAFFGWLTATGSAAILGGIVTAIRFGITGRTGADAANANWLDVILAIVILFVAYLAGGYVAGRMARFNGARQGVAVWIWAVAVAIVVGVVAAIIGTQWDILANLQSFPRLPFTGQNATLVGIISAIVLLIVTLVAAILGGIAGMSFHRRVDRAGWESSRHLSGDRDDVVS